MNIILKKVASAPKHWIVVAVAMLMAVGCAGPYGSIRSNPDIATMFETNTVPTAYHYYYNGRSNQPYVIVGLYPEYHMKSRFWNPLEPNTADFKYKVQFIYYDSTGPASGPPVGSFILDSNGNPVGIWYSRYRSTGVIVHPDKSVTIYSPYEGGPADGPGPSQGADMRH